MPIPPQLLDELSRASPAEFVRTRDRLAAELRRSGEPYAAMEMGARRKPTAVIWVLNQLSRRDRPTLERARRSADELRAAQLGRSAWDAGALRRSAEEFHAAVGALVKQADAILEVAGVTGRRAMLGRIEATLRAALAGKDARNALWRGEL